MLLKTTLSNKIFNKPARMLSRRGEISLAEKITIPTAEYRKNSALISCTVEKIKKNKIQIEKNKGKAAAIHPDIHLIFPYSYFGPQNRRSRLGEQRTLLKFLLRIIEICQRDGYTLQISNDQAKSECSPNKVALSYHSYGRKENLLHYKVADLPDYIILDPEGYSGWSSICHKSIKSLPPVDLEKAKNWHNAFLSSIRKTNISKYQQPKKNQNTSSLKPYIFVALQISDDSSQKHANIAMIEMLHLIEKKFSQSAYNIVVKRHPLCTDKLVRDLIQKWEKMGKIIVSEHSIHDLVADSEAVFTVNSGVGSEALAYLKPVYTFGTCDYQMATHHIVTERDFIQKTEKIEKPIADDHLIKFLYYYRNIYLINVGEASESIKKIKRRIQGTL